MKKAGAEPTLLQDWDNIRTQLQDHLNCEKDQARQKEIQKHIDAKTAEKEAEFQAKLEDMEAQFQSQLAVKEAACQVKLKAKEDEYQHT